MKSNRFLQLSDSYLPFKKTLQQHENSKRKLINYSTEFRYAVKEG